MVTASAEDGSCSRGHRAVCSAAMQTALRCLEGRWKMMILAHLFTEPVMRFSELQRAIPGVSQKDADSATSRARKTRDPQA